MSVWKWVRIIAKILELIADGMDKEAAVLLGLEDK